MGSKFKPENFMVAADGHIAICDYGIPEIEDYVSLF
jgi:hypothetical protein